MGKIPALSFFFFLGLTFQQGAIAKSLYFDSTIISSFLVGTWELSYDGLRGCDGSLLNHNPSKDGKSELIFFRDKSYRRLVWGHRTNGTYSYFEGRLTLNENFSKGWEEVQRVNREFAFKVLDSRTIEPVSYTNLRAHETD